jgi:predicted Zn-dependent protease
MEHRTLLLIAYFHTQRKDQLRELLSQTLEHFHKEGRWSEGNIANLAAACLHCQLYTEAAEYFTQAISQHQRENPTASRGDSVLSGWYQQLASAYTALGKTREAVDAASAAVVCWGFQDTNRRYALDSLKATLAAAKDLPEYIKHLDAETAKTGQDSPILRKALGQVLAEQGKHTESVVQLKKALELQSNDSETHAALIKEYDALGQNDEAARQLLAQIEIERHNLELYKQLAQRFAGNEAEAERAATTIVEAGPTEAENHAAYAEILQAKNRWSEAITQWEQVAELRKLEPTGLVKLAEAQLHEKRRDDARQTLDRLRKTEWPTRFDNVRNQIVQLEQQLQQQ